MVEQQLPVDCIVTNLKAVLPDRVQDDASLSIIGERIAGIGRNEAVQCGEVVGGTTVVDFGGDFVVPGLIDLHVHGCGGADTMDGSATALAQMANSLLRQGTTAFLATTMTVGVEHLRKVLSVGESWNATPMQAEFLGFHLEGPCISPNHRGAQSVLQEESEVLGAVAAITRQVKIVTLAPELAAAQPYIELARSAGFLVSAGHSGASFEQMQQAIAVGVRHLTHAFNAMPGIHHRLPGLLTAALLDPRVTIELIADGVHIHPAVLEMALRLTGPDRVILVSDGTRAVGMPDGEYELGGHQVRLSRGKMTLPDGTIAGGASSLLEGVRFMTGTVGRPLHESVRMASLHPARLLGLDDSYGCLRAGAWATFLRLDSNLGLKEVWVRGRRRIDATAEREQ